MKIVIYYRVSTRDQEESGLGLKAQRHAVAHYINSNGAIVVAEYEEIESGTKSDRAILRQALEHAKLAGATLVVAKLDRLARNVALIAALMETKVPFVCVDMPHATPLTLHILAAIAEYEAKIIGERTAAGLAAAKRDGKKLGAQNKRVFDGLQGKRGWQKTAPLGRAVRARLQRDRYGKLLPIMVALKSRNASLREIADHLNTQGYETSRGTKFSPSTVMRIMRRQAELVA